MVDRRLHDDLRKIYLHLKAPRFDLHGPYPLSESIPVRKQIQCPPPLPSPLSLSPADSSSSSLSPLSFFSSLSSRSPLSPLSPLTFLSFLSSLSSRSPLSPLSSLLFGLVAEALPPPCS
jgi:hypothetical protein